MSNDSAGGVKNYLLDTNVLLHDSDSMFAFHEHYVYILVTVLEELDKFKTTPGETGANARRAARNLDGLREKGKLNNGVDLDDGGKLFVIPFMKNGLELDLSYVDNQLLTTAHRLSDETKRPSIVVTKDVNLRVRADGVDVKAEDYRSDRLHHQHYQGYSQLVVPCELINDLYDSGSVDFDDFDDDLPENHYFELIGLEDPSHRGLARLSLPNTLNKIEENYHMFGIKGRNLAQKFALNALYDDNIKVVTLRGLAGTGKTLLSVAVGLHAILNEERYQRLTITRPVIPVGRDLGFLPGDMDEKMAPWMRPIQDALDMVRETDRSTSKTSIPINKELNGLIDMAPLTYVRGRSISHSFMIVDEAQNMTPHEVKTLLTRAGVNTKLVLTGDTDQIDNPYLDSESNGFSYLISKFKGQRLHAHIELVKGERSELAELAATVL